MVFASKSNQILKASKAAILQNNQVERSQDGILASKWTQYLTKSEGRTFAYDATLEQRLGALTKDQVNAAFKKYVNYDKLTIIKAGDFEKAAKEKNAKEQEKPKTEIKAGSLGGGKN